MTSHRFLLKSEPRAISWKTLLACIAGCGPRIGNGAYGRCVRGHIANGVDQVPQFIGNAILLQIRNVVTQTQECGMRIDRLSGEGHCPRRRNTKLTFCKECWTGTTGISTSRSEARIGR